MSLHKKCIAKPYFFLVIDAALALDNSPRSGNNCSERIW